ncbi:MAG: hypothetical protein R2880_00550 [Deinococcales bacterium]
MRVRDRIAIATIVAVIILLIIQFMQGALAEGPCYSAEWAEQLICSDALLHNYANQVGTHYDELIHKLSLKGDIRLSNEVERQQRSWQRQRNACIYQKDSHHCLLESMALRVGELDKLLDSPYFSSCTLIANPYRNVWTGMQSQISYPKGCLP